GLNDALGAIRVLGLELIEHELTPHLNTVLVNIKERKGAAEQVVVSGILPILALSLRHKGPLTPLTAKLVAELAKGRSGRGSAPRADQHQPRTAPSRCQSHRTHVSRQPAGAFTPPRCGSPSRCRPAPFPRGGPGGGVPPGPVQPERDGSGGGGRRGVGEGGVGEAGGVRLPRRPSSHLRLRLLLRHHGARASVGGGSVRGQHRGFPALLLLLLEPPRQPTDPPLVPLLPPGKLFQPVQGHPVLGEERAQNRKSQDSHVPHVPL
uniref:Uncharacterized protein n=1 Tax=Mola mola TaxID=94237 RepID=A0A3Q3X8R9_MOLML